MYGYMNVNIFNFRLNNYRNYVFYGFFLIQSVCCRSPGYEFGLNCLFKIIIVIIDLQSVSSWLLFSFDL
jgi:hypothetical protein